MLPGPQICRRPRVASRRTVKPVASGGGKTDITKVGLNSIEDDVVKQNLMGKSRYMDKKDWRDASGRKGKVSFALVVETTSLAGEGF